MNKKQLMEAFKDNEINITESELDKMFEYMQKKENEEDEENDENDDKKSKTNDIGRNGFKKFYIERK